mgnify:CR=1 FL=1
MPATSAPTTATSREVLLIGFGGPTRGCCKRVDPCPGEAYCFVSGIFGHNPARKARIEEVTGHYRQLGGYSGYNAHTDKQASALKQELAKRGHPLNIRTGYHHWMPYARTTIAEMARDGVKDAVVLIMAPHQSSVSWDLYLRITGEGIEQAGPNAPRISAVVDPWWNKQGFIEAIAARIREAAGREGINLNDPATGLLLSAHSIPRPVAETSPYCKQVEETAALVVKSLGLKPGDTRVAYQSQPADSRIEWTGPSIERALDELKASGKKAVIGAAVGFLCDNVEVLHDLGIEGKQHANSIGLKFTRAQAVHDHPAFISMLADQVEAKLKALATA